MKLVTLNRFRNLEDDFFKPLSLHGPNLLRNFFGGECFPTECPATGFYPALDIAETENDYTVSVELPGLSSEEVDISLEGRLLTLKGEKKAEFKQEEKNFQRVERVYGSFSRSLRLPEEVDSEAIKADFKHGVLQITIPKAETAKLRRIKISSEKK